MKKLLLLLALIAGSCTTEPNVLVDYDRDADFNTYQTFNWADEAMQVEHDQPQYDNSLNRKRILKAIDSQLTGRGYQKDTSEPDLLVNIHLVIKSKQQVKSQPIMSRYRYWQDYNVNIYDYEEGSLIVDLIDKEKNQLVWQGIISGGLNIKPQEIEPAINSAVALIFSKYTYRGSNQ